MVTLKHRNKLQEFQEHMEGLNRERKEMNDKLEEEKKMFASLVKLSKPATVEVRDNVHMLIFTCNGCEHEMKSGFHCKECLDFNLCDRC